MINVRTEVENVTNARAHYVAQVLEVPVRQVYQEVLDMYFEQNSLDGIIEQMVEFHGMEHYRLVAIEPDPEPGSE